MQKNNYIPALVDPSLGYTLEELASIVHRSKSAVTRKRGIKHFFIGVAPNPVGRGRYLNIYNKDAVKLWQQFITAEEYNEIHHLKDELDSNLYSLDLSLCSFSIKKTDKQTIITIKIQK